MSKATQSVPHTLETNHSQCSSPFEALNQSQNLSPLSQIIRPLSYMRCGGERKSCNHILWILNFLLQCNLILPVMLSCVMTQVSVNSQIRVLVRFSIKANNFQKEYFWKSIYLRFPGSLKPSSSICYILFSSEKNILGLFLFHKSPLKFNELHQPILCSLFQITHIISNSFKL